MIKTTLIGHLGKDAVVNHVNGQQVINFNVAHTETYKDAQGTKHEKTLWVSCSYWTQKPAIANYLKRGTQVYLEGTPSVETYTNNDGKTVAQFRLRVMSVQLLGGSRNDAAPAPQQQQQQQQPNPGTFTDVSDDLPF